MTPPGSAAPPSQMTERDAAFRALGEAIERLVARYPQDADDAFTAGFYGLPAPPPPPPPPALLTLRWYLPLSSLHGETTMPVTIADDQQVIATATLTDADGNPATAGPTGATPAWTISDTTAITLTTDPTGLIATFVPVQSAGHLGVFTATFTDGTITVSDTITVQADSASNATISFGAPTPVVGAQSTPANPATPTVQAQAANLRRGV